MPISKEGLRASVSTADFSRVPSEPVLERLLLDKASGAQRQRLWGGCMLLRAGTHATWVPSVVMLQCKQRMLRAHAALQEERKRDFCELYDPSQPVIIDRFKEDERRASRTVRPCLRHPFSRPSPHESVLTSPLPHGLASGC